MADEGDVKIEIEFCYRRICNSDPVGCRAASVENAEIEVLLVFEN